MRRRDATLALVVAVMVVLALLTVFAIELTDTQANSKANVEGRVHDRAVLAAALLSSLFNAAEQQVPADLRTFGTATVSDRTMDMHEQSNTYLALLGPSGNVIAASEGFTAQAKADLKISAALELVRAGHRYGLGNVLPYGGTGVINLATPLPTPYGRRTLLTGFFPQALTLFLSGDLREIPGVKGSHNYVIDANDAVLASTNPAVPPGHMFTAAQKRALAHTSGDRNGHYYDEAGVANSTWRVVLAAPDGPLFASVTGLHEWLPWIIFAALVVVALIAIALGIRVIRASDKLRDSNAELALRGGELEAANDALERRATELARSNAELEQFASIASHDLQEPLRKVRTFTEQLNVSEAANLSEKGRDYLERANGAAVRMQRLIEDLLKFSRVATHGQPFAPVDMNQVARGVLLDLEVQIARAGAEVHVADLPRVEGDELQMRQLMQNLISNAVKFHREGITPEVTIDASTANGQAQISVSDNGIGFEQQYAGRIFRVFERLHARNRYPGTGIGLALVRKIVERHGGDITTKSEPGVGSTFTVTLPLAAEPDEIRAAAANSAAGERKEHRVTA